MSKKRQKRRNSHSGYRKSEKASQETRKTSFRYRVVSLKFFWGVIAGIGVVTGLWAFFCPKVTVMPLHPLNPSDPLSAPFTISNDGYLMIGDVRVSCTINKIVTAQKVTYLSAEKKRAAAKFVDLSEIAAVIRPGEKYTVECPITRIMKFHSPIESADIAVVVSYKAIPLPIPREEFFRFQSKRNHDGDFVWVPQPVDK